VLGFYGLTEGQIPVVKLFPASYEDGWFFEAKSEGEKELCQMFPEAKYDKDPIYGCSHLKELYLKAKPYFKGAISVPLLWDSTKDTAVSNSSLGLAEMIATQMRCMGTRNKDVLLFPSRVESPEEHKAHADLVKDIHVRVTTAVYKMNATRDGKEHDKLVDKYFQTLDELQHRIKTKGPYLMGENIRFADFVLFISLIRLDLGYQWRFGLGRKNVRENYPGLWEYKQQILELPGIRETVLPRDIMALYFMTPKWVAGNGRTLPQVP
jgi:putative glutathione S-transferase